jgi:hypothetical protein
MMKKFLKLDGHDSKTLLDIHIKNKRNEIAYTASD